MNPHAKKAAEEICASYRLYDTWDRPNILCVIEAAIAADRVEQLEFHKAERNRIEYWRGTALAKHGDGRTVQKIAEEGRAGLEARLRGLAEKWNDQRYYNGQTCAAELLAALEGHP